MKFDVDQRLEIIATVLLALATLGTAWSGYQASRWTGEQAKEFARGTGTRIESTKAASLADSQSQIDVATFTQWVDAYALRRTELADFYFKRFRAEFKPAVVAWIATRPLRNPDAPLTPFAMPQYKLAAQEESERLEARRPHGPGHGERPARHQLRPRSGPVRVGALLRRHGHQARVADDEARASRPGPGGLHRRGDLPGDQAGQRLRLSGRRRVTARGGARRGAHPAAPDAGAS
jgi:hypothetical protein